MKEIKDEIGKIIDKLNIENFVCEVVFKSLIDTTDTLNDIWKLVKESAKEQSQWGKQINTQWIEMERILQQLAKKNRPIITYKQLLEICSTGFPDPEGFVKYMAASGLVVTIQSGKISKNDIVVNNPQWIIDAYKQVIGPQTAVGDVQKIRKGEFTPNAAITVWKDEKFQKYIRTLIRLMEHLGLIATPIGQTSLHYIPSLLPEFECTEINGIIKGRQTSRSYVLDYRKNDIQVPFPNFDKMMAKLISEQKDQNLLHVCRNCCVVWMENHPLGYILCHGGSIIKITLCTKEKQSARLSHETYDAMGIAGETVIKTVHRISNEVSQRFEQTIEKYPVRGLSCNPFPSVGKTPMHYARIRDLRFQKDKTMNCCKDPKSCNQIREEDMNVWGSEGETTWTYNFMVAKKNTVKILTFFSDIK